MTILPKLPKDKWGYTKCVGLNGTLKSLSLYNPLLPTLLVKWCFLLHLNSYCLNMLDKVLFIVQWHLTLSPDLKFPFWFGSHLCSMWPPRHTLILYLLLHQLTLCSYSLPAETVPCIILDGGFKGLYCDLRGCGVPVNVNGVRRTEEINERESPRASVSLVWDCLVVVHLTLPSH